MQGLAFFYSLLVFGRFLRLAFDLFQYWGYFRLSWPPPEKRQNFATKDITVLIMTTGHESRLIPALQSWLGSQPGRIVVTGVENTEAGLESALQSFDSNLVLYQKVPFASAREQMVKGLRSVQTDILVITDDRTYPSPKTLSYIASCFSDPTVGGVTLYREIIPASGKQLSIWESFAALNQVRRRVLHSALAYFHHGQVLNLAGGLTGARTSVLQSDAYYHELWNETWLGRHKLITGEDNTCTRFMVQRGWRTGFLNQNEAKVHAGTSSDSRYMRQVKRWSRDTARSYLKDLHFAFKTGKRKAYVYPLLNITANYASDAAIVAEVVLLTTHVIVSIVSGQTDHRIPALICEHLIVASALTLLEHMPWFLTPSHWVYIPGAILYMYMHAAIVLYSCFTVHKSTWDSRPELIPNKSSGSQS